MKLKTLAEKYNYTCFYCGKKFKLEELSRDHFIPESRANKKSNRRRSTGKGGGHHGHNWRLACKVCNANKGNKPAYLFKV